METEEKLHDLPWLSHAIRSDLYILHSISIYLLPQTETICYQDAESSMNINISKGNDDDFAELVTLLGSPSSSLRNLEFNFVEWDLQWMKQLGGLLDRNRNIQQILFKRNSFDEECISELCQVLRRNAAVKEIIFSESSLGSHGVTLLACALKVNNTLEELQIWDDSIGSKGAEELAKMIEMNAALRLLTVFDSSFVTADPLMSAVLARNRSIEVHIWSVDATKVNKVVEFVPENHTLRIYRLNLWGSCRVACAMGMNTTVKVLDMTGVRLRSKWAKEFRWVLEQNHTLKEVILSKSLLKNKAVVYVAAGLFKNQSLQRLQVDGNWFSGIGVEHLLCPLTRFSALQIQANTTLKSLIFGGPKTKIGRSGLTAILRMLSTNQTVTRFEIRDDLSLKPQDFIKVFNVLERNASLQHLSLQGCRGISGESVARAILETLQVNPWIEYMDLSRTPLENAGMTTPIYQKMGQSSLLEPDVDILKDMPMSSPNSCRVFLCGQDHAGKATLCNSISHHFSASKFPHSEHAKMLVQPIEQVIKPAGLQIKSFRDDDGIKISLWNLAGQHELYPLQDLMFPGHSSASFFFIVSNLFQKPNNRDLKNPAQAEEELQYWLRFIVSNSRRANQQLMLPNVTIVLTHFDKINQQSENMQNIVDVIQRLRGKFQGFVDLYPTVFTIDARSHSSVSKLTYHLRTTSKTILQRVPRVYELCNDLIHEFSDWRARNYNKPVMRWRDFSELCQVKIPSLRIQTRRQGGREIVEMRRKAVAACLHSMGELIYFEKVGFLILDCEWFWGEVLGELISLNASKQETGSGFISKSQLEKILKKNLQSHIPGIGSKVLENLEVNDLVSMMLQLDLCYLQDPSYPNSLLLIPSLLEEGRGKTQQWFLTAPDCVYAGRHLECDDSSHMFLTPGFFPRLQVYLHKKIMGADHQQGAAYSLDKHLIVISINGIHIRVELGGQLGYFVDILACSTKSLTETLRLIQQLIIPAIHSCCNGVPLTEHIIRPDCVRNLTPPRHRKYQSVPVQRLKLAMLSVPADAIYEYKHTWSQVSDGNGRLVLRSGFDFARDLVSEDELREVLHRRYHDLYNLAMELQVPEENSSSTGQESGSIVDPTLGGIAKGVEQVLQRLKIIEQEIRDVKQEIQGLRYYEHRLLLELNRKVDSLVNYSVQLEERKVPNMFYMVQTDSYSRKLVSNMISGMNAIRLHMLCEFRGEMHVVEDQMGCEVMQVDNRAVQLLAPYMKKFMKLVTFALKIGAHLAVGMGEMIPDLSKEVAHLSESSLIYGAAGAVAAGAAALGGRSRVRGGGRDIHQEQRTAQQWVVDFLRDRRCSSGRDIAEKFGLWRVRYRDDGRIAWICRRHINTRAHEIVEVPV
uniref:C-terminal of Roc COR-B domain-containing protein n=1 Tax=Kalanchoe fedtschenkoi TaxID=63787 RepID=A0A7N0VM84_KALFE